MSKLRTVIITAVAAVMTEGIAFACMYHVGADGPDFLGWIGLVVLYPAIALANEFHFAGSIGPLLICFVELFVLYWFVLIIWKRLRYGQRTS
jgi:hypothetical protein